LRKITGSRVAVVGGSIAGCAAAIALARAGCDVTVFERTRGSLRDRGFGIGIPPDTFGRLVAADYIGPSVPVVRGTERLFVVRGGAPSGRVLWRQPLSMQYTDWSVVWQDLRRRIPDQAYRAGITASVADADPTGRAVSTDEGEMRFDLVVGAEGYASGVRRRVAPESAPRLPGYCLWRGTYPVSLLSDVVSRELDHAVTTVCFPGGHCMIYLIPDHRDTTRRLVNWAVYITPPRPLTGTSVLPPGQVPPDLMDVLNRVVDHHFPPLWAGVVRETPADRISVQPVFDVIASRYVSGRMVLAGDAGATARPHTASGAMKAVEDAFALGSACRASAEWTPALAAYDRARCAAGTALVLLGRGLGRAQVEHTPDWGRMSEADFLRWWRGAASGRTSLYE
jgi:2-polyprenyl-6-methoxyphenol hydroxylase-like FAD-dependent oxidoreductase